MFRPLRVGDMNHVFTIGLLNLRFIHMSDYTQNSVRMCVSLARTYIAFIRL